MRAKFYAFMKSLQTKQRFHTKNRFIKIATKKSLRKGDLMRFQHFTRFRLFYFTRFCLNNFTLRFYSIKIPKMSLPFLFGAAMISLLCLQGCKDSSTITMATAAEFRPFEFMEGEEVRGIDIDIAREIAKRLNKQLEIKKMKFDSIIVATSSGTADIAISAITINPTREKMVDFTTPYYEASQVAIVKKGDSRFINIASKDELLEKIASIKDIKIAVAVGTTGHFFAAGDKELDFGGFQNAEVKAYSNASVAMKALQHSQVDIMIIDEMVATVLSRAWWNPNATLLPFRLTQEQYGIAINKSKTKLKESIQKALDEIKNDGTLEKIITSYL